MKKIKIGKTGIEISRIALGTWSMGGDAQWGSQEDEVSIRAIHAAVESGVNVIDTAPAYGFGKSEQLVGRAVREIPREKLVIQTKCGFWWRDNEGAVLIERDGKICRRNLSRRAIMTDVEESLRNLGTDYIDVYITHHQAREPFLVPVEETMDALTELKNQGKIRAIGISNCTEEEIRHYLSCGSVDVLQERFSMLDQDRADRYLPICRENGITFEAFSPLEQGLLSGKYGRDYQIPPGNLRSNIPWYQPEKRELVLTMLESWKELCEKYECNMANLVIAWTCGRAENLAVLGGGRKEAHVMDYIRGGQLELERDDWERMEREIRSVLEKGRRL